MKIAGSYASLLRGVSQQPPEVRQQGQHEDQVNMVPDPVEGLTRRRGTVFEAGVQLTPPDAGFISSLFNKATGYRAFQHTTGARDYLILMREREFETTALPLSSGFKNALNPVIIYNMTEKIFTSVASDAQSIAKLNELAQYGVAAATSVGKYLVYARKGFKPTANTGAGKWLPENVAKNTQGAPVAWVRGGAYTRTYQITIAGATASYLTPNAGVAGAAEAISPENIAQSLLNAWAALGAGRTGTRVGSHVHFQSTDPAVAQSDITVTDGGDGSLIRGCGQVVDNVDDLTLMFKPGQVVQIGTNLETCFYMLAVAKGTGSGFQEVIWREQQYTTTLDWMADIGLRVINIDTVSNIATLGHPSFVLGGGPIQQLPPKAGNANNNPPPAFWNNPITYLGMFQDRLLVGSGSALCVSGAGDYFNFTRSTVVSVLSSDAFEMIAQGGEDDTLRHSVPYSRNHVLFGDKRQYIIGGQSALTPLSANMAIMTTYADAATVAPIAAGGQIYYARNKEGFVDIHQIQPGTYVDSAESFPVSAQVNQYIPADAMQIENIPGAPAALVIRSQAAEQKLWVFHYLDQPDGRKQDAWHRYEFHASSGVLLGMASTPTGLVLLWYRVIQGSPQKYYIVADRLPQAVGSSVNPWLDSQRFYNGLSGGDVQLGDAAYAVAFNKDSERYLIGSPYGGDEYNELLAAYPTQLGFLKGGLTFDSSVTLTNPYSRDGQGKAILSGRTVVARIQPLLTDSAGFKAFVTNGTTTEYSFNGRVLGSLLNTIGQVPVSSGTYTVAVGRETREYRLRLQSHDWKPFTISGIEWIGQAYNRTPRASQS